MVDIVLVQPKIGDMDSFRTKPILPLSLLHSACLVDKEFSVKLIDQRVDSNWKTTLKKSLDNSLLVATTSMTGPQIKHALEVSKFVKQCSDVPVVWGGVHASLLPEQTVSNDYVDIVVQGEGEETLLELANALDRNVSLGEVRGLYYKDNGKVRYTGYRNFVNLNRLPDVPYHLVNVRNYLPIYNRKKSVAMQTSRGCCLNCHYCYNTVFNRQQWRSLSAEKVVDNAKYLVENFGVEDIYFVDDNFFVDFERARKIASGLAKIGVEWQVQGVTVSDVLKMSYEYLSFLERSGLIRITIGAESGSDRIRKLIGKPEPVSQVLEVNRKLSAFNIRVFYSFITGFPTETREDLKKTISLVFKIISENKNARTSPIYNFIPYPGTRMAEFTKKYGFKQPSCLEEWASFSWDNVNVPYIKNKQMFKNLYFSSIFLDNKFKEYETSPIIKLLSYFYKPFARFRVKHLFFRLMVENLVREVFIK